MLFNDVLKLYLREFKALVDKGLLHIFGGSLITKVIGFANSIVLVRILSKEEFGYWGYANNIFQIFLLFGAFGAPAGILQFCSQSKNEGERLSYLKYGLSFGLKSNLSLALMLFLTALYLPLPIPATNAILLWFSFLPILMIFFDSITLYLRSVLRNKAFASITVLNSVASFFAAIAGAISFGAIGVVIGKYIAMSLSIIKGFNILRREFYLLRKIPPLESNKRNEFLRFSVSAMLCNSFSSLLYLIDTFLVGTILRRPEIVASYQTATIIPFNLNFIPIALMTFAYPYFAKHWQNKEWLMINYSKMTKYLVFVNGVISITLFVFAPLFIRILFGAQYLDSILPFRILAIGYFVAGTFRIPAGNTLIAIGKIKVNLFNSIISGLLNILLSLFLIKYYGVVGAAIATVLVFVLSSTIGVGYLLHYLRNNI